MVDPTFINPPPPPRPTLCDLLAGSHVIILVAATFMIVLAVLAKFGDLFVTMPDPVIGGSFFVLFGTPALGHYSRNRPCLVTVMISYC